MAERFKMKPRGLVQRFSSFKLSGLLLGLLVLSITTNRAEGDCEVQCDTAYCIPLSCTNGGYCDGLGVDENTENGTVIANVTVSPPSSTLLYITGPDASYFTTEGTQLLVNGNIDYEATTRGELTISIGCQEPGQTDFSGFLEHNIAVINVNEFDPEFSSTTYYSYLKENSLNGTVLTITPPVVATDDDNDDERFIYSIIGDVPFKLQAAEDACEESPTFEVAGEIDYDTEPLYNFTIMVIDDCEFPTGIKKSDIAVLIVYVEDEDDLPPKFEEDFYYIYEDERTSAIDVLTVFAFDQDRILNNNVTYSFIGQSGDWGCMDFFAIDSQTGDISLLRELDYENALTACNITMQAVQVNDCTMIAEATLIVTVNNVNECPRFVENEFNAEISPDDPFLLQAGSLERLVIGVTDEDLVFQGNFTSDPPDAVKLSLVESTDNGRFVSYFITLSDPSSITADTTIQLFVSDNTTDVPCPQAVANISVSVLTVGLAPDFSQPEYSGLVAENAMIGDIVANVSAVNSDGATAGIVYYLQLVSQGGEFIFNVDPDSGEISVANDTGLDAESVHQFTLLVEARDESGPYYRSSFASVIIDVLDINEFSPSFDGSIYEAEIEEEMIGGSCVLTVQASDSDIDSELQYSIDSSNVPFNISSATGEITTARRLDLEDPTNTEPYYNITVIVSDGTFDDSTYVLITVLDVNDNAPSFFGDEPFDISIPENEMDTIAFNITAYDADETSFVMYQLNDPMDDDRFSLDNVTGTLTITGPFDYETEKEFLLVVVASDTEFSTQTTVVVSITDVNDNAPQFTSTCPFAEVEEGVELGTAVCQVVAEDADDDGMAAVNYTITGGSGMGMFEISDMGLISTATADLDRETTSSFTLEITASDYGTPVLSNTTIVNVSLMDVNDNPPLFEMTTDNIFVEVDDMNAVPTRLYSVKATDEDLSPFDIIQCEQQTDKSSFLVLTSEGGSCDVYSVRQLDASAEPYEVSFDAFNPDRPDEMRSNNFTLNVYVRDTACYITFDPATQDDLLLEKSQLDPSVAVLDLNVTSNCDINAVVYNITEQMYQEDSASNATSSANFTIDSTDGTIFSVDGVLPGAHELVVVAWNESDTTVNDTTSVVIVVTGENNAPYFMNAVYNVKINSSSGEVIDLDPEAVDLDSPSFATGEIDFSEISEVNDDDENTEYFTVSAEGMVSLTAGNQVVNDVYNLTVRVQDRALEPLSSDTLVIIEVDIEPIVDLAAPYISKNCSDVIYIKEEENETVICFVTASSSYNEVVIMDMEKSDYFKFDSNTGEISTKGPIDYEKNPEKFQLLIYAEGATSKLRNYTTITVMVDDINDNAPMFYGLKEFFVEEDGRGETDCNQSIGTVETTDADSKNNSDVVYQTDDPKFEVREEKLMSTVCLRREFHPERTLLTITAVNVGSDGLMNQTSSIIVTVILEDVNDCSPTFDADLYSVVVSELVEGLDLWTGLDYVTDCDDGPNNNKVVFSFAAVQEDYAIFQLFEITDDYGILSVRSVENEIVEQSYRIKVVVKDEGSPPLSTETEVLVSTVVNTTIPYFPPDERNQEISFTENTPSCVSFTEPITFNDSLSVVYILGIVPITGDGLFCVNCSVPQLCSKEDVDRETSSTYNITLIADYEGNGEGTCCSTTSARKRRASVTQNEMNPQNEIVFTVTVEDQADNPPAFVFPSDKLDQFYLAAIDSATIGTSLGTIEGTDADATYDLRFSLQAVSGDSDLINIDSVTGEVRTKDLLYPTLADAAKWTHENESEVEYTVSLCDSPSASAECSSTALTFKVLLSSDHIIIRIDESVEEVKGKQDDLVRCMATAMEIEIFVQFISPRMESATSTPDSSKTDLWLYAVDPNKEWSKYMTFQEFKDKSEVIPHVDDIYTCDGTDFEVTPLRLSSVRPNLAIQAYQAWVPLTLAFIIFIGNLICILLLWLSWKQMLMEGGNDISRTLSVREQGIVNPVFDPDQDAEERYISTQKEDAAVEAREEEEEEEEGTQETPEEEAESVTGSEDPLITKVYLTDGTNTTEITLAEGDAPQNAEQIADTEEHNRLVPIPPLMMDTREYETNEATMDVYPFDEPDEEISVTGNPEEEGAVNIIGESPNDDHPYSTKIFPNTSERELTESPTTEAAVVESPPHIPDPDYDQVEETDNNGKEPPYVNVASEKRASSPPELPDPDYEVMAPGGQQPAAEPIPAVDTGYENVIPFQPTTTGNDADAARPEGKTVTFGGETVVGQGAGDGTSTLDGSAESDSGHSSPATKHASLPDQDEVIGKMGNDSEPSTVDYLEDESLISGGDFPEVGVTSL